MKVTDERKKQVLTEFKKIEAELNELNDSAPFHMKLWGITFISFSEEMNYPEDLSAIFKALVEECRLIEIEGQHDIIYKSTDWIKCAAYLPHNTQQVIFRTHHEGVWCGRFRARTNRQSSDYLGEFRAMTERCEVIGWGVWKDSDYEVIEWQPIPL